MTHAHHCGTMTFSARITRSPRPFDAERGQDAVNGLIGVPQQIAGVIAGAAGCSPYLAELLRLEGEWIVPAFDDPEAAVAQLMAEIPEVSLQDLPVALRRCKRRIALLSGLADLGGVWPLMSYVESCPLIQLRQMRAAWLCWRWARWARAN